jgi:hypothetical protein
VYRAGTQTTKDSKKPKGKNMVQLVQISSTGREDDIRPLFSAYANWLEENIQREFGIQLDSSKFSTASHGLYRSRVFHPIQRYQGSELEEENAHLFVYMELDFRNDHEPERPR